ncbi:MAG: hypothetical protein RL723_489 [Actinomycetota bacterium]
MSSVSDLMAERYGKNPGKKPNRRVVITLASLLLAAFLVWAIWVTLDNADQIKTQDRGYEILSENQALVSFSVQSPAGPAICAIQVLNQGYAVVGYKEVPVAVSGEYETFVNTTQLGVSGLVDKCWLK